MINLTCPKLSSFRPWRRNKGGQWLLTPRRHTFQQRKWKTENSKKKTSKADVLTVALACCSQSLALCDDFTIQASEDSLHSPKFDISGKRSERTCKKKRHGFKLCFCDYIATALVIIDHHLTSITCTLVFCLAKPSSSIGHRQSCAAFAFVCGGLPTEICTLQTRLDNISCLLL